MSRNRTTALRRLAGQIAVAANRLEILSERCDMQLLPSESATLSLAADYCRTQARSVDKYASKTRDARGKKSKKAKKS
jgi:hypothetical protein